MAGHTRSKTDWWWWWWWWWTVSPEPHSPLPHGLWTCINVGSSLYGYIGSSFNAKLTSKRSNFSECVCVCVYRLSVSQDMGSLSSRITFESSAYFLFLGWHNAFRMTRVRSKRRILRRQATTINIFSHFQHFFNSSGEIPHWLCALVSYYKKLKAELLTNPTFLFFKSRAEANFQALCCLAIHKQGLVFWERCSSSTALTPTIKRPPKKKLNK